ncbi:tetratricopeptide repeat protein [bacterium]|nr:tetratricopeptide repeat protein [bacterium]
MALTNLGLALQEQNNLEYAIRNFRKALNLNPKDAAAHTYLGIAFHEQGNLEKAENHLRKAIASTLMTPACS